MEGAQTRGAQSSRLTTRLYFAKDSPAQLKKTLKLIGQGIRDGSRYHPIRSYAAGVASTAGPKDYLGQVKAIYDDFVKRWRYVHDPKGIEWVTVSGPAIFNQVLGFGSPPGQKGFGDCDEATSGLGACLASCGFNLRICTISPPGKRALFTHVFPQVFVKKLGWISADPVVYPKHGLGYTPRHSRIAYWDLDGNLIGASGDFPRSRFKRMLRVNVDGADLAAAEPQEGQQMSFAGLHNGQFEDYGLHHFGLAGMDNAEPLDFSEYGAREFGAYIDDPMPMINGDSFAGLMLEYCDDDVIGFDGDQPLVRTKMLEMHPEDMRAVYTTGKPRPGAVALADDGDVYQWVEIDGLGGFFKRMFKKVRKGIRKVRKGIRKVVKKVRKGVRKGIKFVKSLPKKVFRGIGKMAKKLIKRLPGGKYLLKIYGKIKRVAMKVVRPLMKIVGPIAKKLAPIAGLIPGYGPVIKAALAKAGKFAEVAAKFGVKTDKKGRPRFTSGKQAKAFQAGLRAEAKRMKKSGKARQIAHGKWNRKKMPLVRPAAMVAARPGSTKAKQILRGYDLEYIDTPFDGIGMWG